MHLAKGPQAEPILLPLLVCCVDVALEAVVLYQEDGDKALGASFVAWGLEGRFFLQQEERSRHLASKIQEIHPPHAQHRDRLCGLAILPPQLGKQHSPHCFWSPQRKPPFQMAEVSASSCPLYPWSSQPQEHQGQAIIIWSLQQAPQGDHCTSGHAQGWWEWEQLTLGLCFPRLLLASQSLCLLL